MYLCFICFVQEIQSSSAVWLAFESVISLYIIIGGEKTIKGLISFSYSCNSRMKYVYWRLLLVIWLIRPVVGSGAWVRRIVGPWLSPGSLQINLIRDKSDSQKVCHLGQAERTGTMSGCLATDAHTQSCTHTHSLPVFWLGLCSLMKSLRWRR